MGNCIQGSSRIPWMLEIRELRSWANTCCQGSISLFNVRFLQFLLLLSSSLTPVPPRGFLQLFIDMFSSWASVSNCPLFGLTFLPSHHVLTHLYPGLVKAVAAQFSGTEASWALFYCYNPPASGWIVTHSPHQILYRLTYMPGGREVGHFY